MFPWADGNLLDFWNKQEIHEPDRCIWWTVEQCHGLADGLNTLHSLDKAVTNRAWHGNIHPANILYFRGEFGDTGTLKFSDFGTSLDSKSTDLRASSRARLPTSRYSAPKVKHTQKDHDYIATDVWSLGIVFLQFVAWILHGNAELSRFEQDCDMWAADPDGDGFPNNCASQIWIKHLSETLSDNCKTSPSPVLDDMLKVVVNQVVAAKPPRRRVSDTTDRRHTVSQSSTMAEATLKPEVTMQDVSEQLRVIRDRMSVHSQSYLHDFTFMLHENGKGPLDPRLPSISLNHSEGQEMCLKGFKDTTAEQCTPKVANKWRASARSHDVWIPIRDNLFAKK